MLQLSTGVVVLDIAKRKKRLQGYIQGCEQIQQDRIEKGLPEIRTAAHKGYIADLEELEKALQDEHQRNTPTPS